MLFSKQDLRKIIVPLLIEQALAVTVGMLDTVMVASAGEAAVSGVSLVDTLNLLLIYVFSALAGGGAIVISQLLGKGVKETAQEASRQLVLVVAAAAVFLTLIAVGLRKPLLNWIYGSIDAEVMANARIYFLFTALSYPFLGIYNACAAIFRAAGNSKISMTTSLMMNGINVAGNALLIFVFHMGAAGAAIATLFARIVGAGFMLLRIRSPKANLRIVGLLKIRPEWSLIKRICWIGVPNGIENGMFQFGKVLTQSLVSGFGTVQIAANAAASSLASLQYVPGQAISLAMVVVVGRCVGAGEKEQAKRYTKVLLGSTYGMILLVSVIMCLFAKNLAGLYNLSGDGIALAVQIIICHSLCISTIWPLAFPLPNAFRAASDVRYTMVLSVFSMWVFRVGLSVVFGKMLGMGVMGVWLAMFCDWLFRAVVFVIRFYNGKWLTKYKSLT